MNTIEETLARVPVAEGFVGLHLIEMATGQVLASRFAGPQEPQEEADGAVGAPVEELAAALTDALGRLAELVTTAAVDDDLEDLVVTTARHHHLVRPVPGFADLTGTEVMLALTLDRSRSNLALARYLLLAFEAGLVR